jgi:hypothetical protein
LNAMQLSLLEGFRLWYSAWKCFQAVTEAPNSP